MYWGNYLYFLKNENIFHSNFFYMQKMKGLKKDFQFFLKIILLVPINMFLIWLQIFWNFNDI
jgi:hypothetical protein